MASVAEYPQPREARGAAHGAVKDRVVSVLAADFCPWANRYVYWLKEPIGWFVMALAISVLIGMHVSPVGWTLAAAIGAIIVVGMAWPWFAVRAAGCRLRPAISEIHEGQTCDLVFSVQNRWPIPLWGLAVEGYLDHAGSDATPTIALASVAPLCEADYRFAVTPRLRGRYPIESPMLACSFPFGIWTARKPVRERFPLVVFPRVVPIHDEPPQWEGRICESGDGLRAGQAGEPLGVRDFRGGDRLRHVHWIHTARTGRLTVCERGGPEQQRLDIVLDTSPNTATDECCMDVSAEESTDVAREAMAQRVRVAASLLAHLHARHLPARLTILRGGDHCEPRVYAPGTRGRRRMLTDLAEVPTFGFRGSPALPRAPRSTTQLVVSGDAQGRSVFVDYLATRVTIEVRRQLEPQLARFWREVALVRSIR